jgi:ABC-2 type transport system ATP-binding protein
MILELNHLSFSYAEPVLNTCSLSVETCGCVGLIGKNGAGKTTLLRIIAGILPPLSGEINLNGISIINDPISAKKNLGFAPEIPPLFPDMRVESYLRFAAELRLIPASEIHQKIHTVLDTFDLRPQAKTLIKHLSKGYKQRLGLAQAVIHSPKIILLDEPTSGLDPYQQQQFFTWLEVWKSQSLVLFSSHSLSDVYAHCDRIIELKNGQLSEVPQ